MIKSKPKVLIIDDNYSILEYLKTVLGRYNFEIKTSTNGYEGLHDVAQFKPDIIFLDLMMPNIDGLQVLQLKKVLNDIKDIPVIVISANTGRNNVIAAIEAGADRVLAKPINIKQLKSTIEELLGGDYFSETVSEIEVEIEQPNQKETQSTLFKEKFEEYKESLIEAIKNRDSNSLKSKTKMLRDFTKNKDNIQYDQVLNEIEERYYNKPSDWMFAEMKVKELEQNIRILEKQFIQ